MPIASLIFNLPEESAEHQMALDGWKWKAIVSAILDNLRQDLKYNAENLSGDQLKILEKMRELIVNMAEKENLSIYD